MSEEFVGVQMAKIRQMAIEVDHHGTVIWEGNSNSDEELERVLKMGEKKYLKVY